MSKKIQAPPSGFLAAKIVTIEKGIDEIPDLANRLEDGKPTTPAIRAIIRALEDYTPGLHSNPLSSQKAAIYLADSRVCRVLSVLHEGENKDFEWYSYKEVATLLELALDALHTVYRAEETRSRVYNRVGEECPNKRGNNIPQKRTLSGKKSP